jgi:hypothetical protein
MVSDRKIVEKEGGGPERSGLLRVTDKDFHLLSQEI